MRSASSPQAIANMLGSAGKDVVKKRTDSVFEWIQIEAGEPAMIGTESEPTKVGVPVGPGVENTELQALIF